MQNELKITEKDPQPVPWWTYPCINFLDQRINSTFTVFEYGSGYSTVWLSQRVKKVIAVEHNTDWLNKIKAQVSGNARIIYKECEKGYESEIINQGLFDLVIIDGINRVKCTKYALEALKPAGVIVWDDSERDKYTACIEELKSYGFREICFNGLKPDRRAGRTSLIYRKDNCLGI